MNGGKETVDLKPRMTETWLTLVSAPFIAEKRTYNYSIIILNGFLSFFPFIKSFIIKFGFVENNFIIKISSTYLFSKIIRAIEEGNLQAFFL